MGTLHRTANRCDLELSRVSGAVLRDEDEIRQHEAVLVRRLPVHSCSPIVVPGCTDICLKEAPEKENLGPCRDSVRTSASVEEYPVSKNLTADTARRAVGMGYASTLRCPLTGTHYADAVIVSCCGRSFSNEPLMRALMAAGVCPGCGAAAATIKVHKNAALRKAVAALEDVAAPAPVAKQSTIDYF